MLSVTAKYAGVEVKDEQFGFPNIVPTELEIRRMTALSLEIGIQTSFSLHTFTFGGKLYQQLRGGPIGARLTMAVARIVIELWRRLVRERLDKAGLEVYIEGGYVDDMQHLL